MEVTASLVENLLSSALPRQPCIVDGSKRLTYGDIDSESSRLAVFLRRSGVEAGDRVSIYLPNSWQFVVALFSILKAGAIATLVDFRSSERELNFFLKDSGSSFLFVDRAKESLPVGMSGLIIDTNSDTITGLRETSEPHTAALSRNEDDVMCIVYTGGTTGTSKGASLTYRNFQAVLNGLRKAWNLESGKEVFAQILPMTHSGGLNCGMNSALFSGGTAVIYRSFDSAKFLKGIEEYGITVFAGVPTVFNALVNDPALGKSKLTSLKVCFCSGAPLSEAVANAFQQKTGITINVGWGLTEASPQLTVAPLGVFRPNYVGVPIEGTEIVTVDDKGSPNPLGTAGQLAAKGRQVMKGYWNRQKETANVLTSDGFLLTGDYGYVVQEGVYILGRTKDLINSGGYKIWPHEVESVLLENDNVKEVAVVGVPDSFYGESVKAYIVLRSKTTEGDLRSFCRERLSGFKVPKYIEFVYALPKSSVGKILHRELRKKNLAK